MKICSNIYICEKYVVLFHVSWLKKTAKVKVFQHEINLFIFSGGPLFQYLIFFLKLFECSRQTKACLITKFRHLIFQAIVCHLHIQLLFYVQEHEKFETEKNVSKIRSDCTKVFFLLVIFKVRFFGCNYQSLLINELRFG